MFNFIKRNKKRVVVAMSGGLDSSMVAEMLVGKGYECIGVFMRLDIEGSCCDEAAARRVCQKFGMRFYPVDLSIKFKKEVKDYFLKAYASGITPNPCVKCNKFIKFGELLKVAKKLDAQYLATGHYIKLKKKRGVHKIYRPKDRAKDQTYFLYGLVQEQLKHLMFPLEKSVKENIRKQAEAECIPYTKKESQDVCFLSGEHNGYLKANLKLEKGEIKTVDGKVVGEHNGLALYTIGQRKGVEIGGIGPFYVVRMDYDANVLYVTDDSNSPELFSNILVASEVNWIAGDNLKFPLKCNAMIRYRQKETPCVVKKGNNGKFIVEFKEKQRAVTVGQSVVFYKKDELLGGGVIN